MARVKILPEEPAERKMAEFLHKLGGEPINIYYVKELELELKVLVAKFNSGKILPFETLNILQAEEDVVLEYEFRGIEEIKALEKEREGRIVEIRKKYEGRELNEIERQFYPSCLDHLFEEELQSLSELKNELTHYRETIESVSLNVSSAAGNPDYWKVRETEAPPEPAPDAQAPEVDTLTDKECLQKLVDTGFITENTNIKTKTVYAKTRAVTVPKIYKELLKMTNDNERAERIMRNNISGVEAGLKQYLSRRNKK